MPQSLFQVYVHIVFSTKHRQPLIYPKIETELHDYIGGICKRMGCSPLKIGGYVDHVHILCRLSKKVAIVKLLEEIKSHSSKWIKTKGDNLKNFYWQDGYGAFSVGMEHLEGLTNYLERQHDHHQKETYEKEFIGLLIENEIEYDERYMWD